MRPKPSNLLYLGVGARLALALGCAAVVWAVTLWALR